MPTLRAQVAFGADTPAATDRFVITPHFDVGVFDPTAGTDAQKLADDLAAAMVTYSGSTREVEVKLYDVAGAKPNYPLATKTLLSGNFPASTCPRELALCLSYRSGNGPRRRGRLYVPLAIIGNNATDLRPTATQLQRITDLAPYLADLGGANVDWVVYSRRDNLATSVNAAWCDNEWDVMRSRGQNPTTRRNAAALSE